MIRNITYALELANAIYTLQEQKQAMLDLGIVSQAVLGTNVSLVGFNCTPTSPVSMSVDVAPGTIFKYIAVDATPFGEAPASIAADTTHNLLKSAFNLDKITLPFVAPTTAGFSRNDVIQINILEEDDNPAELPFWNGTNPTTGLPNTPIFASKNTTRSCNVVISVVAGTAAATGTQATPTPTAGYVGMWVITTTQGDATVDSGNIAAYANSPSPFITETLQQKISQATGDSRYVLQANNYNFRVMQPGGQTIPASSVDTKLLFTSSDSTFPTGNYDLTANKFQPTIPDFYHVIAKIAIANMAINASFTVSLVKNGTVIATTGDITSAAGNISVTIADQVYLNGTDYIEVHVEQSDTVSRNTIGVVNETYFTGWRVG